MSICKLGAQKRVLQHFSTAAYNDYSQQRFGRRKPSRGNGQEERYKNRQNKENKKNENLGSDIFRTRKSETYFDTSGSLKDGRGRMRGNSEGNLAYGREEKTDNSVKLLKDEWIGDVVYGISPVISALKANRRTIHALYVQEGLEKNKNEELWRTLNSLTEATGLPKYTVGKHALNMLSENRPHQGLILDADPLQFESFDVFPSASDVWDSSHHQVGPPVWLCLDEVSDPQNFGAILRSALFLGVNGVLTCHRNSAPLSGVVSKASAGAMEILTVYSARNLPRTLQSAREQGWAVYGAAAGSDAVSCRGLRSKKPTVLVVGNEGRGLRTNVRQQCDLFVQVDYVGKNKTVMVNDDRHFGLVDSLNVSVATGILLHQLLSKDL